MNAIAIAAAALAVTGCGSPDSRPDLDAAPGMAHSGGSDSSSDSTGGSTDGSGNYGDADVGDIRNPGDAIDASVQSAADADSSIGCPTGPMTSLHYAAGASIDPNGSYPPGAFGFNLADVSSADEANSLPLGVLGLAWLGLCAGADPNFVSTVQPYVGNSKIFGFYLMDEPDPTGQWNPLCPVANLKAESDWIHANVPGKKTFIAMLNMGSSRAPSYANTYNPSNSGIDLYGVDPYPCRTDLNGCEDAMIPAGVMAAEAWGIPRTAIVPVYQTFGGGGWVDDTGGAYRLPTASDETQILATWASVVPSPVFDFAYSWAPQNNDTALAGSPDLQRLFAIRNGSTCATRAGD